MGENTTTVMPRRLRSKRKLSRRAVIIIVLLALVFAAVGTYGGYKLWNRFYVAQVDLANAVQVDGKLDGQNFTVITSAAEFKGPRPLALVTHGYQADQRVTRQPRMGAFTQELIDAGWIVASSNAHGNAWGGHGSEQDYAALYREVAKHHEISKTVIVSLSMGAISGLSLVEDRAIPNLAAWVGVSPVTDLPALAYAPEWDNKVTGTISADEIKNLSPLNRALPTDVPLVVYASDTDTVAAPPVHATPFAQKYGAKIVTCTGGHVAPDCFRASDIMALAGR